MNTKQVLALLGTFAATMVFGPLMASVRADIPWRHPQVALQANQQPADQLLRAFAAEQGILLQIADQARPAVSGDFRGLSPRQLLDAVCDAGELVWFWDGARLYVDPAAEMQSRPLKFDMITPERAAAVFKSLGFDSGPASHAVVIRGENGVITIVGSQKFLEIAEPVLRGLDAQEKERRAEIEAEAARQADAARAKDDEMQVRVFRLTYASASDIVVHGTSSQTTVPGIARALQNIMGNAAGALSTGADSTERRRDIPGLRGTGLAAIGPSPRAAGDAHSGHAANILGTGGNNDDADKPQAMIQADPRLNAVIVRDTAARMPLYEQLIQQLDVYSPVIEISATVVDIQANNDRSLGVEFLSFGDGHSSTIGRIGFEADRAYNTGDGSNTGVTPTFNDGTNLVRGPGLNTSVLVPVSGYQLLTRIQALEDKGQAQLVTSPTVITLENVEANLQQEDTVFVRVSAREATDLYDVHAGVQLRVTPTVIREGDQVTFRLLVSVKDGSFSDLTVDGVPSTQESAINTQALVPADKTLLIGGYFVEKHNDTARQVPGLGNLPVIGALFRRTDKVHSRAQRFYFITPRLVDIQKEARLNKPPVAAAKSPLPANFTDPAVVARQATELVGRNLPPTDPAVAAH